jgi:prepilin-type N-terminal cleavage/methylation domain-containing protein
MRRFFKDERGFTFTELIIALVLLGLISATFLGSISAGMKALEVADERVTAESIAKSEMEFVKLIAYQPVTQSLSVTEYEYLPLSQEDIDAGYSISSLDRDRNNDGIRDEEYIPADPDRNVVAGVPWNNYVGNPNFGKEWIGDDTGLQRVVIIVKRFDREIFRLEGNKSSHDVSNLA